jgi:hypothetical protein
MMESRWDFRTCGGPGGATSVHAHASSTGRLQIDFGGFSRDSPAMERGRRACESKDIRNITWTED